MTEEIQPVEKASRDVPKRLQPYYLGLLRKGPRWNETEGGDATALLPQHLAFLRQEIERGRYVVAGPVMDGGDVVGMMILNVVNAEEAQQVANEDPGVKAGRLRVEILPVLLPALDGIRVSY